MLPYALHEKVKSEIDSMLEAGIAEQCNSSFASPIVIVPKTMVLLDYVSIIGC